MLITTGSQQGLDLVGKVLIDAGAPVAVEAPTYLGALQAYVPYQPTFVNLECDGEGPRPESIADLARRAPGTRFVYLLPNFQNPTGLQIPGDRRDALVAAAQSAGVPLVEDNPYGDLWYDQAPPAPISSRWPEGCVYLGSFSKVLTPGVPPRLHRRAPGRLSRSLLAAKQAADLHTPGFNQRVVYEVVKDGFLDRHVPTIRERYRAQRDAMAAALDRAPAGRHHVADAAAAACSSGCGCPRVSTPWRCSTRRSRPASPSCPARRSSPPTPIRAPCASASSP